ncbi:hypothetical protein SY88_19210 [Clostridiales bacterium PH28_bin88]|nr:hypothetical protein SY88_19210 [Clostridiales bacterium PH28_bin88]
MLHVMIADDEILERRAIKLILETYRPDYQVVGEAGDGNAALEVALSIKPDVILLDVRMPEMDGLEVARLLRRSLPGTRVVIITAYGEFEYAREAVTLGASEYLLKPVDTGELVALLDRLDREVEVERRAREETERLRTALREVMPASRRGAGVETTTLEVAAGERSNSACIEEAARFVEENYQQDLSLEEVSRYVFLSPSHFSRLFKQVKGCNFSEFLTQVRMKEARRLLLATDCSVAEVATRIGYRDARYFGQVFKKNEGCTPASFRRNAAKLGKNATLRTSHGRGWNY